MTGAVEVLWCVVLLVGSASALGQHPVQRPVLLQHAVPSSPAGTTAEQNITDRDIYQAAIDSSSWPFEDQFLQTSISNNSHTVVGQHHATEQETNNLRPIAHMPDTFDNYRSQYKMVKGLGYYKVVKGRHLTWEEARAACRAEGAHLAVVNSRREAAALKNLYYEEGIKTDLVTHVAWVGVYRPQGQHHYTTVHGTQLNKTGFNVWKDGRDKGTEERCVLLHVESEAALVSTKCHWGHHHLCEHEL